jgi:hypothetical protein
LLKPEIALVGTRTTVALPVVDISTTLQVRYRADRARRTTSVAVLPPPQTAPLQGLKDGALGASGEAMQEDAAFAVVDGEAWGAVVVGRAARRPTLATPLCFQADEKEFKLSTILLAACAGSE